MAPVRRAWRVLPVLAFAPYLAGMASHTETAPVVAARPTPAVVVPHTMHAVPVRLVRVTRPAAVSIEPVHRSRRPVTPAGTKTPVARGRTGPTQWAALNSAIYRIPDPRARGVRWVVTTSHGHWGTADWDRDIIYVSPAVPERYLYSVAVHEWSHLLSVFAYNGDVSAAVNAMNAHFGGAGQSGLDGAENAADCMALEQGATWTGYTSCTNAAWRRLADRLVKGNRL